MFYKLYRLFLVSILSWSLLNISQPAFAQGVKSTSGPVKTNSSGQKSVTTTYEFDSVGKGLETTMIATITMLIGGLIVSRMLFHYRPLTWDVKIAAVGGAAYLVGEIMSTMKNKETLDRMTLEIEKKAGETNENQLERINDLKKSYDEVKATLQQKKTFQQTAAAAFGVATAINLAQYVKENSGIVACNTALTAAHIKLTNCSSTAAVGDTSCASCLPIVTAFQTAFNARYTAKSLPRPSSLSKTEIQARDAKLKTATCATGAAVGIVEPALTSCKGKLILSELEEPFGNPITTLTGSMDSWNKIFPTEYMNEVITKEKLPWYASFGQKVFDLVIPSASASWVGLVGFTGAAIVLAVSLSKSTGVLFDSWMFSHGWRTSIWATMMVFAYAAADATQSVIDDINGHNKHINGILQKLNNMEKGTKAIGTGRVNIDTVSVIPKNGIDLVDKDGKKVTTDCLTSQGNSNCTPLTAGTDQASFTGLPEGVTEISQQLLSLGDGLSGRSNISAATMNTANSIAGKSAAIRKMVEAQKAQVKKLSNGKFDLDKGQKQLTDKLAQGYKDAFKKSEMSPSGFLASIGASPINLPEAGAVEEVTKTAAVGEANVFDLTTPSTPDLSSFDFKFSDDSAPALAVEAASEEIVDYDMPLEQIGKVDGPSLFEVISGRYLKSGYPRLLEIEEVKK